jgi:hypothetical protein
MQEESIESAARDLMSLSDYNAVMMAGPQLSPRQRKRKADRERFASKMANDPQFKADKQAAYRERQKRMRRADKSCQAISKALGNVDLDPSTLCNYARDVQPRAMDMSPDEFIKDLYAYCVRENLVQSVPEESDAGAGGVESESQHSDRGRPPRLSTVPANRRFGPDESVLHKIREATCLAQHGFCLCYVGGNPENRRLVGQLKGFAPTKAAQWSKLVNGKQTQFGRGGFVEPGRVMCVVYRPGQDGGVSRVEGTDSLLSTADYQAALDMVKGCLPEPCRLEVEQYALQQIQYILSIPDCPRQPQHTDFPTDAASGRDGSDGLTILIALDTEAAWFIKPYLYTYEIRIQVPRFWAIVFKGNVPHAGAELLRTRMTDMRFHIYLTKGSARVPSETDGSIYNVRQL